MKKLLITALLLLSQQVMASWMLVSTSVSGSSFFIDFSTLKIINKNKRVWVLSDYQKPIDAFSKPVYSAKELIEFNCYEMKYRPISQVVFSGNKGEGEIIQILNESPQWSFPLPDSSFDTITKAVCKR
jgi:hypothetical protein